MHIAPLRAAIDEVGGHPRPRACPPPVAESRTGAVCAAVCREQACFVRRSYRRAPQTDGCPYGDVIGLL